MEINIQHNDNRRGTFVMIMSPAVTNPPTPSKYCMPLCVGPLDFSKSDCLMTRPTQRSDVENDKTWKARAVSPNAN